MSDGTDGPLGDAILQSGPPSCARCAWFVDFIESFDCRRYPPIKLFGNDQYTLGYYPHTHPTLFCGEFRERNWTTQ